MKAKNGILKGEIKVPNGKLIKCRVQIVKGKIHTISFIGDFFMHPEEKIEELEEKLIGVDYDKEVIKHVVSEFFNHVLLIGANQEDFIRVITEAA
jgi:hypothetical protein